MYTECGSIANRQPWPFHKANLSRALTSLLQWAKRTDPPPPPTAVTHLTIGFYEHTRRLGERKRRRWKMQCAERKCKSAIFSIIYDDTIY